MVTTFILHLYISNGNVFVKATAGVHFLDNIG